MAVILMLFFVSSGWFSLRTKNWHGEHKERTSLPRAVNTLDASCARQAIAARQTALFFSRAAGLQPTTTHTHSLSLWVEKPGIMSAERGRQAVHIKLTLHLV